MPDSLDIAADVATIELLPTQLANQIAAGEVVERPSSVVKELIENSLDAGATQIDIDLDKGGSKRILIRDNGCGINKDQLTLALSRHATSKIKTLDDLEAILSLGFRGEALASISSVSRLTLTSKTQKQQQAWSAYTEGRDMVVQIKPASHPTGTTIEVLDLFFNTPARRKFLRTEKTEFNHIDELLKRIALSRFDCSFNLKHNGQLLRQYKASHTPAQINKRVSMICGAHFQQNCLHIENNHHLLQVSGWIINPSIRTENKAGYKQAPLQYCYVNGRMMKDKLIYHAIGQAYTPYFNNQTDNTVHPSYVLFIKIDAKDVDVNVHPSKHEVRFHQARLVHDVIYQALAEALQQVSLLNVHASASVIDINTDIAITEERAEERTEKNNYSTDNQQDNNQAYSINEPAEVENDSLFSGNLLSNNLLSNNLLSNNRSLSNKITKFMPEPLSKKTLAYAHDLYQPLQTEQNIEPPLSHTASRPNNSSLNQEILMPNEPTEQFDHNVSESPIFNGYYGRALMVIERHYLLLEKENKLLIANLHQIEKLLWQKQFAQASTQPLASQSLLIPQRIPLSDQEWQTAQDHQEILQQFGIQLRLTPPKSIKQGTILKINLMFRQYNLQQFIPDLLFFLQSIDQAPLPSSTTEPATTQVILKLSHWLSEQLPQTELFSLAQALQLISKVEQQSLRLDENQLNIVETQLLTHVFNIS